MCVGDIDITIAEHQGGAYSLVSSVPGGDFNRGRHRASDAVNSGERSRESVLIVNDMPDQLDLMRVLLRRSGYDVITAEDGQAGYEAVLSACPDIIISDVSMPRLDGINMCRLIREHRELQTTPILLVSAVHKDSLSAMEGLRAGADDYLEAPYDPMRLVARVAQLLGRKRIEAALRQSEERYRRLFENANDIIYMQDLAGNFTSANLMAETVTGYTLDELLGVNFSRFFSAEDTAKMRAMTGRKLSGETDSTSYEVVFRSKNGRAVNLEVNTSLICENGIPVGVQGIARDITERKRAEERLRKKEFQLADAQRVAHIGSYEWDTATNACACSDELYHIFGLDPQSAEFSGELVADYLRPADFQSLRHLFKKAIFDDEPFTREFHLVKADGSSLVVQVRGKKVLDETGGDAKVIGTVQDITELKEAEAALRKSEEQLMQAQKMEAIGQLAGGVAHDFNNLLTAIMGYSDLALKNLDQTNPTRHHVEEIKKSGIRAASLTRQLLAFSRRQVLQPQILDLNAVVADMAQMLPRVIGENILLRTAFGPSLGSIRADPGQIEQVILNLVVNARDAMPEGGKLTIETHNAYLEENCSLSHAEVTPGPYVVLAVSDTGQGIDEETRARIFEPFFTTKAAGKGTGLGLSTVYGIVKQWDGHVSLYSEVGTGTVFKIYLPRVDEEAKEYRHIVETTETPRGRETILVVEDEETLRELTREILSINGYEVLVADSGTAALQICERHAGPLHLLLTDVVMPEVSGRALAERVIGMRPEMSVLYMSGYTDDTIVHHGVPDENANFIQKPFGVDSLTRKVREVLDKVAR